MIETNQYPDFITIDGGEGGTGATFQELQDGVGLPLFTALPIVTALLEKYDIRHQMKIFASGKLITPDKIAIALGLGADLVNIAAVGVKSPTQISKDHIIIKKKDGRVQSINDYKLKLINYK